MKKTIIYLLFILLLGTSFISACTRLTSSGVSEATDNSVPLTSASRYSETSITTVDPTQTPSPSPSATPSPSPAPTKEPVFIYLDYEGNLLDGPAPDLFAEVDGIKYYIFEENGLFGIKKETGEILTEAMYDRIYNYSSITQRAYVSIDGLTGMIDQNGAVVIEPKYDSGLIWLDEYEGKLFFFLQDGLYGALNLNGKLVFEPRYADLYSVYGNPAYIIVINEEGKSGLIDMNGNLVVNFQFETYEIVTPSPSGYFFTSDELWSIEGDHYVTFGYMGDIYLSPDDSVFWPCSDDGQNFGIFNINTGKYEYPPEGGSVEDTWVNVYGSLVGAFGTYPYTTFSYNGKEGIADIKAGKIIIEPLYENIEYCQNGYIKYAQDGKYGLMNLEGQKLLPCLYDDILFTSPFGEVVVSTSDGHGIVNTSGETLLAPQDTYRFGPFLNYFDGFQISTGEQDIGIADRDGTIRIVPEKGIVVQLDWDLWDEEYDYTDDYFFILDSTDGDKILRKDGFIDIPDFVNYSGDFIIVQDENNLMGVINSSGEVIIEPYAESIEIEYDTTSDHGGEICLIVTEAN